MANRIDKLHKQAVDYVEKQESLGKQQSDNTLDKGLVQKLLAGISDDDVIGSIERHDAVLNDDSDAIQEELRKNVEMKTETVINADEYLSALESNLNKIEQIGQASDMVENSLSESSTKQRISELEEIKKLLSEETQTSINVINAETPRSQILQTPENQNDSRNIMGFTQPESNSYKMNSQSTIEHIRDQMGDGTDYFDTVGMTSGNNPKIELIPKGEQYHLTGDTASGNFLSKDNPGDTPNERQENLQLPPENDGGQVRIVESTRAHLGIKSTIAPQEKWADKAGYTAREGNEQTFIPNKNKKGAIANGMYKIVTEKSDSSPQAENDNQPESSKTQERNSFIQQLRDMVKSDSTMEENSVSKTETNASNTDDDSNSTEAIFSREVEKIQRDISQDKKKENDFRESLKVKVATNNNEQKRIEEINRQMDFEQQQIFKEKQKGKNEIDER